jgi:hypothetical protein
MPAPIGMLRDSVHLSDDPQAVMEHEQNEARNKHRGDPPSHPAPDIGPFHCILPFFIAGWPPGGLTERGNLQSVQRRTTMSIFPAKIG